MNKYRTVFKIEARQEMRKISRDIALGILHKLTELETNPYAFGTTPMVGDPSLRRLRVGDYRVLYTVDNDQLIVIVIQVGHRSAIYD